MKDVTFFDPTIYTMICLSHCYSFNWWIWCSTNRNGLWCFTNTNGM